MLLNNLRATVAAIADDIVTLKTEQGQRIDIPHDLLPDAKQGMEVYLAADAKPLISSDQHAKDILNEIIKE